MRVQFGLDDDGPGMGEERSSLMDNRSGPPVYTVSTSDLFNDDGRVLSTAHDRSGCPTVNVTDDTMVTVQGQTMSAALAAQLGFIRKTGSGYEEVGSAASGGSAPERAPDQLKKVGMPLMRNSDDDEVGSSNAPATLELLPAETEAEIEAVYQEHGEAVMESAVATAIISFENTEAMTQAAASIGMEATVFSDRFRAIYGVFEAQADQYTNQKYGVAIKDVWEWAERNLPKDALNRVKMQHFHGDLKGYDGVVKEYLVNTRPAQMPEGVKTRKLTNGMELVKIDGYPEMSVATAVHLGLL